MMLIQVFAAVISCLYQSFHYRYVGDFTCQEENDSLSLQQTGLLVRDVAAV